ncbi:uncharacterized protein METZ01_LOCUS357141, partial [marine metagenome]
TIRNSVKTNAGGLVLQGSANAHGMQLYWSGGAYGFLDGAWAGWDIRKAVNGNLEAWVGNAGFICACEGSVAAHCCVVAPILCATSYAKIGATCVCTHGGTGRLKLHGSGDNYLLVGPHNDNGWAYIESTNNANGFYFGTNQGNFLFDDGFLGSYNDGEVDVGFGGNRFRCGSFTQNVSADNILLAGGVTSGSTIGTTGNICTSGGIICGPTVCGVSWVCGGCVCATQGGWSLRTGGCIYAAGCVRGEVSVCSNGFLHAGTYVSAATYMQASSYVQASSHMCAGSYICAGGNLTVNGTTALNNTVNISGTTNMNGS